jgi:hypothetical protein
MSGRLLDPLINVPPAIQQGDTTTWIDLPQSDVEGTLYTAADWNLVFSYVQNAGSAGPASVTAAAEGTGWLTTLSATATQAMVPLALYNWQVQLVGKTGDQISEGIVITVDTGSFLVQANLATVSAGFDNRSLNVRTLLALQAGLAAAAGTGGAPVLSYKIGTRELRYRDVADLLKAIEYYQAAVISEQVKGSLAQNQGNPRKLYMRFPGSWGGNAW